MTTVSRIVVFGSSIIIAFTTVCSAQCVTNGNPEAWIAKVEKCESPRPYLIKMFSASDWTPLIHGTPESYASDLLNKQPGVLLTLKPLKVREYTTKYDSNNHPSLHWLSQWKGPRTHKSFRFFWSGLDANCSKISQEKPSGWFIVFSCCDSNPLQYVVCLLNTTPVTNELYSVRIQ
jgi:hypothetical protein